MRSDLRAGCAVLAVTIATDASASLERAAAVFREWQARLTELYVAAGLEPRTASSFATTLIAASEGAVVLSRAQQSLDPFEQVAAFMIETTP